MKEIARVEILDKTCDDCRFELAGCDRRYPNKIECNMLNDRKNWKVEQFPETFDELKILCEGIKGVEVYTEYISCHKLLFWKNGVISSETDDGEEIVYIENRTPQQMWNIIKNLIGK